MNLSMSKLSLAQRLFVLSLFYYLPIVILGLQFYQQIEKDIRFANKELKGSAYLASVYPVLHTLAQPESAGNLGAAQTDFEKAKSDYDDAFGTTKVSADVSASLQTLGNKKDAALVNDAMGKLTTLIGKVADGSNLTLDPDLDSFYTQDVFTVKLPQLIAGSTSLLLLAEGNSAKTELSPDDKANFLIAINNLDTATQGISDDLDSAFGGNADGALKSNLSGLLGSFLNAAHNTLNAANEVSTRYHGDMHTPVDLGSLRNKYSELQKNAVDFQNHVHTELVRLLELRRHNFYKHLIVSFGVSGMTALLASLFAVFMSRSILSAIGRIVTRIDDIGQHEFKKPIPFLNERNEFGKLAAALQSFQNSTMAMLELQAEQEEARVKEEEARRAAAAAREAEMEKQLKENDKRKVMLDLADQFETTVKSIVEGVATASTELSSSAENLARLADDAIQQAEAAASSSDQASGNVQTIAAATEELAVTTKEITRQTQMSSEIVSQAVAQANATNNDIAGLLEASKKIGGVVQIINDIAWQTNLLALNATIEAARAGEVGKGFAVVAAEVKALAGQTTKATEQIGSQIETIQGSTNHAVSSIGKITTTIEQISTIASNVVISVQQQSSATESMAGNIEHAAEETRNVSGVISTVKDSSRNTAEAASEVMNAAQELSHQAEKLRSEIDRFLVTIRAS